MSFPILKTSRLILKPITLKDALALYQLLSQIEVCLYNNFSPLDNKSQAQDLIQQDLVNSYQKIGIRFSIFDMADNFLGTCGVHDYDQKSKLAKIGYELDPKFWRNGYMFEALNTLFNYLFSDLCLFEVKSIQAEVMSLNTPSINLLKKFNFIKTRSKLTNKDIQYYEMDNVSWFNNNNK